MDAELEWIQSQIADFGTRDGSFRYPEEFRQRAARWATRQRRGGQTQAAIQRQVDVPWVTIQRWMQTLTEQAETESTSLVPVQIDRLSSSATADGMVLTSPDGWRLEGLTVDQAVEVLGRLR